ncbi:MAG: RidA family protein [Candidatus Coatesbacteria bacterium]|nr:MAG: RidA family protein [Candidatus Coatesbacteria bacterium]
MRAEIKTEAAPAAIGPYAQAIHAGDFVFTSGQIALAPETGELVGDDAAAQTRRVMDNLTAVLAAAGASWEDVVKTDIFLVDLEDFAPVNDVYATYVGSPPPARATVQVAALPRGARVEIAAVVYVGGK